MAENKQMHSSKDLPTQSEIGILETVREGSADDQHQARWR